MAGANSHEVRVVCRTPRPDREGDRRLFFSVDGAEKAVSVRIGSLSAALVANLSDIVVDLIEIAAWVYAIDAAVSRGGLVGQRMGSDWRRQFDVTAPVRRIDAWSKPGVTRALEELLFFLSGDRFRFKFVANGETAPVGRYFEFDVSSGRSPDSIVLFSGGLDSFAGAVEEMVERGHRVVLVSHSSSTKIAKVQRELCDSIRRQLGTAAIWHIPTDIKLAKGTVKEGTHRTRSFLFAALAAAVGSVFKLPGATFYENGLVSLNLPPVASVTGTRATRTTHPQTLTRFTEFFGRLLVREQRFANPYFWRTKADVVETIVRLGFGDQIPHTRSCADVHNMTTQYTHCGRCSQCIDRRFGVLVANAAPLDPEEAYEVDLMTGARTDVRDREMALSYLRNALRFETLDPIELEAMYPEMAAAVAHLDQPEATARERVAHLLRRHASGVLGAMRQATSTRRPDAFPEGSLPRLFGDAMREPINVRETPPPARSTESPVDRLRLTFGKNGRSVCIDDCVTFGGGSCQLLFALAQSWLSAVGQGLPSEEYPFMEARRLAKILGLDDEASVRKRVNRARALLRRRFEQADRGPDIAAKIIENLPWHGYRLRPELVRIELAEGATAPRRRRSNPETASSARPADPERPRHRT